MMFPGSIHYSIRIDALTGEQFPRWFGTAITGTGVGHLEDQLAFELHQGWMTLTSTRSTITSTNQRSKTQRHMVPVGHALGQVLETGDEIGLWRDSHGCWTYSLLRGNALVVGVGHFAGKVGEDIEVTWHPADIKSQMPAPGISVPASTIRANSHVTVHLAGHRFELKEKQDRAIEQYYVHCIHLGGCPFVIDADWPPTIALLKTERLHVRESLAAYLAFQDDVGKAFRDISAGFLRDSKHWVPSEYMAERAKRLKERETTINEMYRQFGMRPPETP